MKREILFRGRNKHSYEWEFGCYYKQTEFYGDEIEDHVIITSREELSYDQALVCYSVQPETVGQFTGLIDKNGKKVFEGDIFHLDDEIIAVVIFKDGCFRLEEYGLCGAWTESGFDECGGGWVVIECDPIDWYTIRDMEIIGNIHDNRELLKSGVEGCG